MKRNSRLTVRRTVAAHRTLARRAAPPIGTDVEGWVDAWRAPAAAPFDLEADIRDELDALSWVDLGRLARHPGDAD